MQKKEEDREYRKLLSKLDKLEQNANMIQGYVEQKGKGEFDRNQIIWENMKTEKIIQASDEKLTQLIIDDILLQTVNLLNELQERQRAKKETVFKNEILFSLVEQFQELEDDVLDWKNARLKYDFKEQEFQNRHPAPRKPYQKEDESVTLQVQNSNIEKFKQYQDQRERAVKKSHHYNAQNMQSFTQITQELIEQFLLEMAQKIEKHQDQFTMNTYKSQFTV